MLPNKRVEYYFKLCESLLSFANLSWWLIDLEDDENTFYCNQTMCETFSLDKKQIRHSVSQTCPIAGDYNSNIAIKNSEKAQQIFREYQQLRNGEIREYNNSFPYFNPVTEQTTFFASRAKALVSDESGNALLLLGIIEPEIASTDLYNKLKIDSLTGLFNRREFDAQLAFLLNLAKREEHPISLLMCDVDHFKQYNDSLGHYAGDECLIKIAQCISQTCLRATDLVCRYGGEEFAVIVYDTVSVAADLAEAIRTQVQALKLPHPVHHTPVSISVGYCSLIPDQTISVKTLIEYADSALYRAKQLGRNRSLQYQK